MDIRIAGKNITVKEDVKAHLREKLVKLEKYAPRLVESHVVLKKEKLLLVAEITILAKNFRAYGEGQAKDNMFAAIDQAYIRVEKQLKRFREKVKDHHRNEEGVGGGKVQRALAAFESASESLDEKSTRIVRTKNFIAVKPMFPEDASLQLQDSSKPFLVFQNASTKKMNVIFKREDGAHGLVESEF